MTLRLNLFLGDYLDVEITSFGKQPARKGSAKNSIPHTRVRLAGHNQGYLPVTCEFDQRLDDIRRFELDHFGAHISC